EGVVEAGRLDLAVGRFQASDGGGREVELVIHARVVPPEVEEAEELVPARIDGFEPDLVADLADPDLRQAKRLLRLSSAGVLDRPDLQIRPVPRGGLDPAIDVLDRDARNPFHRKGFFEYF